MILEPKNTRYAHSDGHTDICYGSDRRNILTCGSDGNVRIWDGSEDDDPSADSIADMALAVACSKDKFFVATDSNYVQGFTYPERKRDKIMFRFSAPVTHIAISSNSKYLAASSCDMEIQILNMETNKITTLNGHTAPVLGISLDPFDKYIVSSSCDGTVKIWEITTGSLIKTFSEMLPIKNDFFKAICLGRTAWKSMSGSFLAVPKDLEVIAYKRGTWEVAFKLKSDKIEKSLSIVLSSPCGNYIAAASIGGEIVIWEIKHKTEICHYKDPKKVGISGMAWHPDGNEIAFTDRLGRLSVLAGVNDEIIKYMTSEENTKFEEIADDMTDNNEIDTNVLLDDDDNDDENCISLEKIKAAYKNDSEDEESPRSPGSTATGTIIKEPEVPLTKPQPPFQPSSTPSHFEPRCLCYNAVGIVRYYDSDKTIDVQFHDTLFHHALFLRSFGVCTLATLSVNALCLAVPSLEENPSKFSCLPLSSWAGNKEWTVYMPENEDIVSIAAGTNWVAVATSVNNLRIFTSAGTQKQIVALPGPVVSMSGFEKKILIVCHMGAGLFENQNEGFIIYKISNLSVSVLTPFQPLPLFPKSVLKWIGFTDEGTPCSFDSEGFLRVLGHDNLHWEVVHDFRMQQKSSSDHYFIIGLSEKYQNIRCVLCRNSHYPLIINVPTVLEIPFKLPLCALDTEKSILEETYWRLMFCLQTLEKISTDDNEFQSEISGFEQTLKQTALKLFAEACRNSEDLRALDVAALMSSHPLEMAIKYASKVGKMYLTEKLNKIKPVDWRGHYLVAEHFSTRNDTSENHNEGSKSLCSQQDLFDGGLIKNAEKENRSMDHSTKSIEQSNSPEALEVSSVNPFKKTQPQKNEGPKGLKYFDTLMSKETPKISKPQFQNKPLKLKSLAANKEKILESKSKKPTFFLWFSMRKASLIEKYPNLSEGALIKLGMTLFREEMSKTNIEENIGDSNKLNSNDSKKRFCDEDNESEAKRCKSLDETTEN